MTTSQDVPLVRRSLVERYERAIAAALHWKQVTGGTNAKLARLVGGVNCSSITNFLNRKDGYEPKPSRPSMLRILEGIERVCKVLDCIVDGDLGRLDSIIEGDERAYFQDHTLRARDLRADPRLERSLLVARDVYVQAVYGPPSFRPFMCSNVALLFASRVDKPESVRISASTLELTGQRSLRLEQVARESLDVARPGFRIGDHLSYCGYTLAFVGMLCADAEPLGLGLELLFESVTFEASETSGTWSNALRVVDRLIERREPGWERAATRLAALAREHDGPRLAAALRESDTPSLVRFWRNVAPAVLDRAALDTEVRS